MAFTVYPDPPGAPLEVASGKSGSCQFAERRGGDPPEMFLRVAAFPSGRRLVLRLAAEGGDETQVQPGETALIRGAPGTGGTSVANAMCTADADGTLLVRVALLRSDAVSWRLVVYNPGNARSSVTFVVAVAEAEMRHPWIDVGEATLDLGDLREGIGAAAMLAVANRGTGTLVLSGAEVFSATSDFKVALVGERAVAPGARANVGRVEFRSARPGGVRRATTVISSNDPRAGDTPGHSNSLGLEATVVEVEQLRRADVYLDVVGPTPANVVRALARFLKNPRLAERFVAQAPTYVARALIYARAIALHEALQSAGATARVEERPPDVP